MSNFGSASEGRFGIPSSPEALANQRFTILTVAAPERLHLRDQELEDSTCCRIAGRDCCGEARAIKRLTIQILYGQPCAH